MIAIIGDKDTILPYQALGFKIYPCDLKAARITAEKALVENKVIFFTPEIFPAIKELINQFGRSPLPCFVSLPVLEEKVSEERIREIVKKATGTDLLKK
ncbi:MAG: V-type ATP synthase subunit F [candidate division WOR-3 bacterium]